MSTSQTDVIVEPGTDSYDAALDTPLGITNPPIDELLARASSKYALVIYAAKRARQINDYYNQLGDGILEYVGPLVEPGPAGEAAVDRAARDPRRPARAHRRRVRSSAMSRLREEHQGLGRRPCPGSSSEWVEESPPTRPAPWCASSRGRAQRPGRSTESALQFVGARPLRRSPVSRPYRGVRRCSRGSARAARTGCRPGSGRSATADLLSRAATGRADDLLDRDPAHRHVSSAVRPRDGIRRCGCIRQPSRMSRPCGAVARLSWSPPLAPDGADTGPGPVFRGRRNHHPWPNYCWARPDALRTIWPVCGSWSPPAALVNPWTRCALSETAVPVSRDTPSPGSPAQRGAEVTLIAGHTVGLPDPAGVEVVHISSAAQLQDAVTKTRSCGRSADHGGSGGRFPAGPRCDQQDQKEPRGRR
ncbi:DNA-directed RNA polymerase, omega subunit [Mycobacteroides abscessus]|nr:DNA-directed RNA polymerase, omega subunit [Mycobacteroides abscessus]